MSKPRLISFDICPFVQRAAIMLEFGGIEYDVEYIELNDTPDWFKEISPLGKVPLLDIDGTILFESAVICDYLDEVHGLNMYPADPLQKALQRGLIEFGSDLLGKQWMLNMSKNDEEYTERMAALKNQLLRLETHMENTPYFSGEKFGMVDVVYAPLLQRMKVLEERFGQDVFSAVPKVKAWKDVLMDLEYLKKSAVPDLEDRIENRVIGMQGYFAGLAK